MSMCTRVRIYMAIMMTAPLICAGTLAQAQSQGLEEIIVTAQKREQNLQDVSVSVTALPEGTIQKMGMEGFRDWSKYVPGITMFQGGDPARRMGPAATIRGVTHITRGQLWETSATATTSFTIGQVPFFNGDPGLYDLNRVEVLRGPQGTLFGISSMGGTIRFIPNEAETDEFSGEVGVGSGLIKDGGKLYDVDVMVNVPIIEDVLAIRLAGKHGQNDGFIDHYMIPLNETLPSHPQVIDREGFFQRAIDANNTVEDANVKETTGGRLSLTYTPNERVSIKAFSTWQVMDYKTVSTADLNDRRGEPVASVFSLVPQSDDYSVSSIEASFDLGLGVLEYVGGYYQSDNSENFDTTAQAPNFLNGAIPALDADGSGGLPPDPYPVRATFPFATHSEIYTNELRLQGLDKALGGALFGSDLKFDYVIGAFFQKEKRDGTFSVAIPDWNLNRGPNTVPILTDDGVILASEGGSDYSNKAVFLDFTLHLNDKLSIGAGARYFDQDFESGEYRFGDFYSGKAANGATVGDDLTANDTPQNFGKITEDGITPRVTVSYRLNDDRLVYFTASQGKRLAQGFPNPDALLGTPDPATCTALADELGILTYLQNGTISDTVWSYDLGLKSTWMNNRMLLNTSIYHLIWSDFQQSVRLIHFNPICNAQVPANVGEVESNGFELEMVYAFNDHWTLNTAISYTDATFSKVSEGVSSSLPGVDLKPGDGIRNTAPWTAAVGLEYQFDLPPILNNDFLGYIRADWNFVDERMNNFGDEELLRGDLVRSRFFADAYHLTDLRLGIDSDDWSIGFYVSNLFNETAIYESSQHLVQPNIRTGAINQPRTVGFNVRRGF